MSRSTGFNALRFDSTYQTYIGGSSHHVYMRSRFGRIYQTCIGGRDGIRRECIKLVKTRRVSNVTVGEARQ
jgi:hypothetical protein